MDAAVHSASEAQGGKPLSCLRVGTEEGYQRWARTYDQDPNPLLAREERHILPLLPSLAGKRVLDLACGTGRWLEKLAARGALQAVGVDYSAAMLQVADSKPALTGRLARADCLKLPFHASVFDLAICSFALTHVPDLNGIACELAAILKPNSDVFVTDLHSDAYTQGWRTSFRDEHGSVEIETAPHTAEEITQCFQNEGFEHRTIDELYLEEPERPVFSRARKEHLFGLASQVPAILFFHFRRGFPEARQECR